MKNWLLIGIWVMFFQMSCDRSDIRAEVSKIPFMSEESSWADSILTTLTLDEKLGQLLIYEGSNPGKLERIRLCNAIILGQIGGIVLEQMPLEGYLSLIDSIQRLSKIPLLVGSQEAEFINNQFSDLLPLPSSEVLAYTQNDSLQRYVNQLFIQQAKTLGINWSHKQEEMTPGLVDQMNHNGILNFGNIPQISELNDSEKERLYSLIQAGLSGLRVDRQVFAEDITPPSFRRRLQKDYDFDGILLSEWDSDKLPFMLESGIDMFLVKTNPDNAIFKLKRLLNSGVLTEKQLDQSIKRILKAKYWTLKSGALMFRPPLSRNAISIQASIAPFSLNQNGNADLDYQKVVSHFRAPTWNLIKQKLYQRSITLASNPEGLLPFQDVYNKSFNIWEYSRNPLNEFRATFDIYADYKVHRKPGDREGLKGFLHHDQYLDVVVIDNYIIRPEKDAEFLASIRLANQNKHLIIINFGAPQNLTQFDPSMTIVQIPERNVITESLAASILFGGFKPTGSLPFVLQQMTNLPGNLSFEANRMIKGLPQEVGMDPKKLVGIDAIVNSAIDGGVIPGAQVLVAKKGKIVYNKAFGYHTYRKRQKVKTQDLYDVASITKVAATTMALMRLVDQKKISIDSKLKDVLDLPEKSTLKYITLRKLMTHQSGLQINMPVGKYLGYRDQPNAQCDSFFCNTQTEQYDVKVADDFYFQGRYADSIWQRVNRIQPYRRKRTRYSDVNFYLLQQVVEHQYGLPLDQVVAKFFYKPLGLRHIMFNPRNTFDRAHMIPTENDKRWRHQLLRGYVHDETAAILGGVAGHAGLFSDAADLAVLFQMLMNKGKYANQNFISQNTINQFTKKQYGSSRGLGFDKPGSRNTSACSREASGYTFGHTGFTGTCIWADPKEELIYIFLSNRVHPYARNPLIVRQETRRRIHEVIYDAIGSYKSKSLPELIDELPIQPMVLKAEGGLGTRSD